MPQANTSKVSDSAITGPPKIKIGKKVFYDLDKIPEWLASREISSARVQN